MSPSIRWRIAIPYVALILLTMAGLLIYLSDLVRDAYLDNLEDQLEAEARLVGDVLDLHLARQSPGDAIDPLVEHYAGIVEARVTIIAPDGTVVGDSTADWREMDNHLYRPEVQEALETGQGSTIRYSRTVGYEMLYVAIPVVAGDELVGISRVSLPLNLIDENIAQLRQTILSATVLVAAVAALLALLIAERTARPIRQLTEVAQQLSEGNLSARLLPTTRDEIGTLTRTFNQMTDRLRATIVTLTEERGRLAAVLENMADGALITDAGGRVRLINPAAARLLGTDTESALGRSFAQVARDHRIIELWQECCAECEERVAPVEIGRLEAFVQVIVTPLWDADPNSCLVILQDLTRVRRLETVRRDFISNISHELRTPLASLKALVETLRDGALEDPPAARRFLNGMETEVDALTQMVRELLELSRIESGQVPFQIQSVAVEDVLLPPVERLRPQAERARLDLSVAVPPDLPRVLSDADRLHQVITNLVHNAIKFTQPGGRIHVQAEKFHLSNSETPTPATLTIDPDLLSPGWWILISVRDNGVGIPADDLPRIFERFYKADRARSGGGTGLGLAIAKHIVQAHNGQIWAESVQGQGSTFYVALPALTPH
jgi:two-component system phosphate regulon sensor histidine kinase PhoR